MHDNQDKDEIIFGVHAVLEAIQSKKTINQIWIDPQFKHSEVLHEIQKNGFLLKHVPPEKFRKVTNKNHQGILAFIAPIDYWLLSDLVEKVFEENLNPLFVILEKVTDVRNIGGIARSVVCAGGQALILAQKGTGNVTSDAIKASSGALHHIRVCREKNLRSTIKFLQSSGIQVVACTEKAKDSIYTCDFTKPTALLMGSENEGISQELLATVNQSVLIPMVGPIHSLNVSVATGIVLFEALKQRGV